MSPGGITFSADCLFSFTAELYFKSGQYAIDYDKIAALALSVFNAMSYYYLNYENIELAKSCKRLLEIVEEYPVKNEAQKLQLIADQLELSEEQLGPVKLENPTISDREFKSLVKES